MRFIGRRRLRELEERAELAEDLRRQAWTLSHAVLREQAEKGLLRQALERAEADVAYWKARAEKFLDQIAFKQGMIISPTMTPEPAPTESHFDSVFAALGTSEINRDKGPAPASAAPVAPTVEGVDAAAAQAAIAQALAGVGAARP